jgi:peptidoglycan/LPS O-acetylase OafA/YrhL
MSVLPDKQNTLYFPEIDSLRFLAFLIVFLGHSALPITAHFAKVAWYGVEFFFLISGFLLTRILVVEYQKHSSISIKMYFLRRILRIWPLYFTYLAVILFLSVFIFHSAFSIERSLGNFLFIDNFFTAAGWRNSNYYYGHLWTVSVEEQYYLILPFLIWGFLKISRQKVKFIFFLIFILLFTGKLIAVILKVKYPFIHVLPLSADSFLMGVAAGFLYIEYTISEKKQIFLVVTGIFLLLSVLLFPSKGDTNFHLLIIYPLQAAGFLFILLGIIGGKNYKLNRLLKDKTLMFLGKISFGLYVFHHIVSIRLQPFLKDKTVIIQLLGLGLSLIIIIAIASISFYLLEKPFLALKMKFQIVNSGV